PRPQRPFLRTVIIPGQRGQRAIGGYVDAVYVREERAGDLAAGSVVDRHLQRHVAAGLGDDDLDGDVQRLTAIVDNAVPDPRGVHLGRWFLVVGAYGDRLVGAGRHVEHPADALGPDGPGRSGGPPGRPAVRRGQHVR